MKSILSICVALYLAVLVSGDRWNFRPVTRCTESDVYFVPTDSTVNTRTACAAAAPNATLSRGEFERDTTIVQAGQAYAVCSCEMKNCTNTQTNVTTVTFEDCHFCSGVGVSIVITNGTCH